MARPGAYIRDVQLLEELNNKIVSSGETMSNIDVSVGNYINGIRDSLERDLNTIQMKLNEAEARLSEAESALTVCQASQAMALAAGIPGPSCMMEEGAVEAARMEVEKWQMRYGQGQRILGECQQEIMEYNGPGGGHSLILAMSGQQTPKASQLLRGCIEKLQDILGSDVGASAGSSAGTGLATAAVSATPGKISGFNMGSKQDAQLEGALVSSALKERPAIIEQNRKDVANALGVELGAPMTIGEADRQSANPNHSSEFLLDSNGDWFQFNGRWYNRNWAPQETIEGMQGMSVPRYSKNLDYNYDYSINCATTSAAYALRRSGIPLWAKGNPEQDGNLNTWLSRGNHSFDIWNNVDGTKATPTRYSDWMEKQGYGFFQRMSPEDYKTFFEEECKEKGTYIVTTSWKKGGGHATILERDEDGKLYFIEPQVYQDYMTDGDGRRSIDDLIDRMAPYQRLSGNGVMRVDDKLLNLDFVNLFEK